MSALITLHGVRLQAADVTLFDDLTCHVPDDARIALVGHNGSGKSTLLSLLAGERAPDAGERVARRGLRIARAEQFVPQALLDRPLVDAALEALAPAVRETRRWRAERALAEAGLDADLHAVPVRALSGGQQNLLLLARAALADPDVMLLDEPGNHMDLAALARLRAWLGGVRVPWVMVSHDRHLMNATATSTWFLRGGSIAGIALPFDAARVALAEADAAAGVRRAREQREIDRLEASAKRLAEWGRTFDNEGLSRKARSMERRVDRLRDARTETVAPSPLSLVLDATPLTARQVIAIEHAELPWPGRPGHVLVRTADLYVRPGDRIALLGRNGTGKSTTLRALLAAQHDRDGAIRFNPQVRCGWYEQDLADFTADETRLDWLAARTPATEPEIRRTLLQAGVPWSAHQQPVTQLSGGEKARMVFARLRLERPNLLLLDEPTNHIDLDGREELMTALRDTGATVLVTSHDRWFLETVATRWWWIEGGELREIEDPSPFLARVEQDREEVPGQARAGREPTPEARRQPASVRPGERAGTSEPDEPHERDEPDALLARIENLERLLAEDAARRPKHRKPERTRAWRQELERCWARLERSTRQ